MPLQTQLPMLVRPPQAPDPFATMRDVMGFRADEMKLKQMQEAQGDEEALKAAYQQYGMDPKAHPQILQAIGPRNPILAEKLRSAWEQEDVARQKNQMGLGKSQFDAWNAILPFAESTALMMQNNPEKWGQGVRQLKQLGDIAKRMGAPPEMLGEIDRLGDQPDEQGQQFVAQIPQWVQVMGKNLTMYQEAIRAAERDKGGPLTEDETIAVWERVSELQRQGSDRPIKVDYWDPATKTSRSRWIRPSQAEGLDVQKPPTGTQFPEQPTVVLEKPPAEEIANQPIPGGTWTHQAVYGAAETYLLTGELKTNPRAQDPRQKANHDAVYNSAYARIRNESTLPELRATYAALNLGQKALMKQYLQTSAFVDSATKGIDELKQVLSEYPRTNIPVLNEAKILFDRNLRNDPSLSRAQVWMFNATRDYAKATSGSSGSVAQMTDAQIKASELIASLRQGEDALNAALDTMQQDMKNQVNAQRGKLSETRQGIVGLLDTTIGKPWLADDDPASKDRPPQGASGGAAPPQRLDDLRIQYTENGQPRVMRFDTKEQADAAMAKAGVTAPAAKTTTAPPAPGPPPANPKVGDTWQSPTGPVKWDGKRWK